MQRAKKIALTLVSFAALSPLLSGCAMMEEEEGDIDEIQHVDDIGTDPYGAKTFVCHRTSSRTNSETVIEIALSALPSHLGHGDTVGSTCAPACVPSDEVCGDAIDNDCDGTVDETCPPPPPPCDPVPEVCGDGLDNDCDGTVDNGCPPPCVPSAEVCDGEDNDCDGVADEGCVGDHAWFDTDRDGVQEDGETGAAGVVFTLRTPTGAVVAIAVSNAEGNYYFSGVPAGSYFIEVSPPPGYTVMPIDASGNDATDSDFDPDLNTTEIFTLGAEEHTYDIDVGIAEIIGG